MRSLLTAATKVVVFQWIAEDSPIPNRSRRRPRGRLGGLHGGVALIGGNSRASTGMMIPRFRAHDVRNGPQRCFPAP